METIAVLFGAQSVEHEVSIVTALQIMENLDPQRYTVLPIYIARSGVWYSSPAMSKVESFRRDALAQTLADADRVEWLAVPGAPVRLLPANGVSDVKKGLFFGKSRASAVVREYAVDVVIPALHGTYGEDGSVQGFLELTGVPYTSAGVVASAIGMDKIAMKSVFADHGIPIVNYACLRRENWQDDQTAMVTDVLSKVQLPVFVKPSTLGSSVGISRVDDETSLRQAVDIAFAYDERVIVEEAVQDAMEVNCSVLGDELSARVSPCERPLSWERFLTYDDKYLRGGFNKGGDSGRELPARLPQPVTERVQSLAQRCFQAIGAKGVVRVDFLVAPGDRVFVNEINTIPGSLAFYLWEADGLDYPDLLVELIEIAKRVQQRRRENLTSFDTNLLEQFHGGKFGK